MPGLDDGNERLEQARAVMQPFLSKLASMPEVQAVFILSSSARNALNQTRFDEDSDFDVALVLDVPMAASEWRPQPADTYELLTSRVPAWMPNFLFYVTVPWGQMEVNVHQLIFQYENDGRTVWDGEKCDTYLTKCEVILDREGRFEQLIERKTEAGWAQVRLDQLRLANRITWDIREMPLRQANRTGAASGHYLLNLAIDEVVDAIYTLRGQFVPSKKWKLVQLLSRALIDTAEARLLDEALQCDPTSLIDLERRIRSLEAFCNSVEGLEVSGPAAAANRRAFQARLQLRRTTFADSLGDTFGVSIAEAVRNVVNFSLCGSSADVVTMFATYAQFASGQPVVAQISAQRQQ